MAAISPAKSADTLTFTDIAGDPQWATTETVSRNEGVHPLTVRRWVSEHKVTAYRMPDRTFRVYLPSVRKFRDSICGLISP